MKVQVSDHRVTRRRSFKAPLRVRIWKFAIPDQRAESESLSEKGTFFATNSLLRVGTKVEILLKLPVEITGEPTNEWLCTGHVLLVERDKYLRGKLGVVGQLDRYHILRAQTA